MSSTRQANGGHARAVKLTPAQHSASARKAVQARWAKHRRYAGHADTTTVSHAQGATWWAWGT